MKFNVVFFLLISLGIPLLIAFQVKGYIINWTIEIGIAIPSFFAGFKIEKLKPAKKIITISSLLVFMFFISFILNPQIVYKKMIAIHSKKEIFGKPLVFNYVDADRNTYNNDMYKNKIVLLEYWFVGCNPCYLKMKELKKLAEHYKNNKDVIILTVNAGQIDSYERFQKEIERLPDNMNYVYDSASLVANKLKIEGFPTEFIIDKKGIIRDQLVGYGKDVSLIYLNKTIKKIDALLNEK